METMEDCNCEHQELRVLNIRGGGVQYKMQCIICGKTGQPIAIAKLTGEQMKNAPPVDQNLRSEYYRTKSEQSSLAYQNAQAEKNREWWARYNEYMESAAWKVKRYKALHRDNWLCQSCMENRATQVHHTTYAHFGDEPLFELQSVCDACHTRITEIDRGKRNAYLPKLSALD